MKGKRKVWIHLTVWGLFYLLLFTWFNSFSSWQETALRVTGLLGLQAILFYSNLLFFMPRLLENKRYVLYGLTMMGAIFSVLWLSYQVEWMIMDLFFEDYNFWKGRQHPEHHEHARRMAKRKGWLMHSRMFMHALTTFSSLFLSSVLRNVMTKRKREQDVLVLQNQVLETESKALKSQLNPHFLFNTLNNIYALAQAQAPQTPEAVYRLSNLLRYTIYDSNKPQVSLEEEVKYMKSYVDLQLLKDEQIEKVSFESSGVSSGHQIAPMLLIPFLENSFKHSNFEDVEHGWITCRLQVQDNQLEFSCANSVASHITPKDETGGVGLENVRKRLELLYAEKHTLNIEQGKTFKVTLTLDLT